MSLLAFAIAAGTLNPLPIPSEPCKPISTPAGTMCAPSLKVAQALKVYGVIRTQYEADAKRICHGLAGDGYQAWETKEPKEWLCVK